MIPRRDFITLLGGAAAWPLMARAQQAKVPVIGFLRAGTNRGIVEPPFRQGLREGGYIEGQNVDILYRYADYEFDRLPALAADLVGRRVAVIVAQGAAPALVAKAATTTIPIVFETANDPVASALVASLRSPGGNMTGVNMVSDALYAKGVQILHELLPASNSVALLINPKNPAPLGRRETEDATRVLGLNLTVLEASDSGEIERAFARVAAQHLGGILVNTDGLFDSQIDFVVTLAARYRVPAMYWQPEQVQAGGLMSYGSSLKEALRIVGNYTARILKGEKPSDLPIQQSTRFSFVLNLKAAKAIGLELPTSILLRADEVIE
jgi:putative ABC transport system substrate-binding protein